MDRSAYEADREKSRVMARRSEHEANRLLGNPDDARLLIIKADDFGMCHAINAATLQALRDRIASSTTLMVPCPWAPHALQLLAERPEIPFGVHLTLIREHRAYRWGRSPRRIASLR